MVLKVNVNKYGLMPDIHLQPMTYAGRRGSKRISIMSPTRLLITKMIMIAGDSNIDKSWSDSNS